MCTRDHAPPHVLENLGYLNHHNILLYRTCFWLTRITGRSDNFHGRLCAKSQVTSKDGPGAAVTVRTLNAGAGKRVTKPRGDRRPRGTRRSCDAGRTGVMADRSGEGRLRKLDRECCPPSASAIAGSAELSAGARAQLRLQRAGRCARPRHQCAQRRVAGAPGASAAGVADEWSARHDGGPGRPERAAGPAGREVLDASRFASRSLGLGILASVGSAVTGVTDWQHTHEEDRRVGWCTAS